MAMEEVTIMVIFALPGVIQWVAGLGKNEAVGGPWTAMMIFTFTISFMGNSTSPSFSMLSYTAKHPKAFSYYQIWGISSYCWFIIIYIYNFSRNWSNFIRGKC
jgi:hypothetical protein